jgi:hypothetical protein
MDAGGCLPRGFFEGLNAARSREFTKRVGSAASAGGLVVRPRSLDGPSLRRASRRARFDANHCVRDRWPCHRHHRSPSTRRRRTSRPPTRSTTNILRLRPPPPCAGHFRNPSPHAPLRTAAHRTPPRQRNRLHLCHPLHLRTSPELLSTLHRQFPWRNLARAHVGARPMPTRPPCRLNISFCQDPGTLLHDVHP